MKRVLLSILLVAVLAGPLSCGWFGGSDFDGPVRLVPDGALELVLVNVSEAAQGRTELPAELEEEVVALEVFGDIQRQARASLPSGRAIISEGEFDFEDIRNRLRELGYVAGVHRGYGFWESSDGTQAYALLEDEGYVVGGVFDAVIDILRDYSRESGLLWNDDEGELRQALEMAGPGLVATAARDCQLENNVGCRAVAWAFSRGEERRTVVEGSAALLFRDGTAAAGAAAAIERSIGTNELIRLTNILTSGSTILLKVDINRDDFPLLQFPVTLGR